MSDKPDGGYAFPRVGEGVGDPRYDAPGMTLRDYFAAASLTAVIADMRAHQSINIKGAALTAYTIADAMLAERDK